MLCSNVIAAVDCSAELSSCQHSDFISCHSANSAIYLPQIKHRLAHFTGTGTHKNTTANISSPKQSCFLLNVHYKAVFHIIFIGKIIIINGWIVVSFQININALQYFRLMTIKEIMTFLYQTICRQARNTVAQISYGPVPVYMNSLSACLFQLSPSLTRSLVPRA